MNAMKELRRGNRGERDLLRGVRGNNAIPFESPALRGDQNTRIDQRRHGDFGSVGWLRVIAARAFQ